MPPINRIAHLASLPIRNMDAKTIAVHNVLFMFRMKC